MEVMRVMCSDGSYECRDAEEDVAARMRSQGSPRADGALLDSDRVAEVDGPRAVVTAISRGPDAEPQPSRALSGWYLLEVADADATTAHARQAPLCGTVEVRPLLES